MSRAFALLLFLVTPSLFAAETPRVESLRTQPRGEATYFVVTIRPPDNLAMPAVAAIDLGGRYEGERRRLARLPRLVPQDERTAAVYSGLDLPLAARRDGSLRFVGRVRGQEKAKVLLVYPVKTTDSGRKKRSLIEELSALKWAELPLTLDFGRATALKAFAGKRDSESAPAVEDLQGQWAQAQARHFAVLEARTRDFSYFGLARTLTGRKYRVPAPSFAERNTTREKAYRQLYETTTGSAALTESLALHRFREGSARDRGEREIAIKDVPGITIGEHPWQKMMDGRKPDPEPLAELTPRDFYYLTFRSVRALLDMGDLLDQWGGNLLNGYEISSRDYQLRERYEKQLCIRRTELARTLGPALIREIAVTGSDVYLREGSDVTVLFHVTNRALFLAAVAPFVQAARKEFGKRLKESKTDYRGVAIESFVTPRREVSLHRASIGDFVIYSNSPIAIRKILDVQAKRRMSLAQSLDFQYMRTVFRCGERGEDGFAFLPDAFIRKLVGPESKIKEKRRLEALTSLRMMTDAALFLGWETGRLPADRAALLKESGLKAEEIEMPEGKDLVWDGESRTAVSEAYNTLAFATPLLELPLDKVTPQESLDYQMFRKEYLDLWRRYFDPVGMRFSLQDKRVRVETYILPLIDGGGYRDLRWLTGEGTTKLDLASLSPKTLMQWTVHLAGWPLGKRVSDQFFLRFDDSPKYAELLELWIRQEDEPGDEEKWDKRMEQALFRLPITLGLRIGDKNSFSELLETIDEHPNVKEKRVLPLYKGISITRLKIDNGWIDKFNLYHAQSDGVCYFSTSLDSLRDIIDRAAELRQRREKGGEQVELNSSLYLAPEAMFSAARAFRGYLEWESHRRAVANGPLWLALRRAGVVKEFNSPQARQTARNFFGFVPVSPDGSAYRYDREREEVVNEGYGSLQRPRLRRTLPEGSPLEQMLQQLRTVRADLRFREDGVHTTVTIERKPMKK